MTTTRDDLGKHVRDVWVAWASRQLSPKASWLVRWDDLGEFDREVDRQIGEALFARGAASRDSTIAALVGLLEEVIAKVRVGVRLQTKIRAAVEAQKENK